MDWKTCAIILDGVSKTKSITNEAICGGDLDSERRYKKSS